MQNFLKARDIDQVVHFTRLANLPSILQQGIIPRDTLVLRDIRFEFNDGYRHDGYLNASCFTLSWPNYKMFYAARCEHQDVKWAVIECAPSVLWEKPCIFSAENAASGAARSVDAAQRTGVPGIEAMFAEVADKPTRTQMRLPNWYPTNPQAEVLVCDVVEPTYFVRVHIADATERQQYANRFPQFAYTTGWEGARSDWQHWK
ncbi:hypothetical protein DP49_1178 [Burkholderia pseudomallei]|uniref:DarT ssDNA thymidine ADP-ribosyltransferase family protein n=1 Tax=Burkholderia pseudomallei TaxID=28450 RepID=UPI0005104D73|nr:DarT ssDNA thymidine ADP-ribosyltransferase family protein [Burkholderia pseudomallei]KGC96461.1 hypothetical protein DP62_5754 [Burkholderia pseudomallei]KGD55127.1 hypothetical protein DP49_1178 [Burkholderia pseudomallei]